MPLVELAVVAAVVEARRIHPLPAAFAAAAPGVDFDGDAVTDGELVNRRADLDYCAHVFVGRA
jgi:hypothetical protein